MTYLPAVPNVVRDARGRVKLAGLGSIYSLIQQRYPSYTAPTTTPTTTTPTTTAPLPTVGFTSPFVQPAPAPAPSQPVPAPIPAPTSPAAPAPMPGSITPAAITPPAPVPVQAPAPPPPTVTTAAAPPPAPHSDPMAPSGGGGSAIDASAFYTQLLPQPGVPSGIPDLTMPASAQPTDAIPPASTSSGGGKGLLVAAALGAALLMLRKR